MFKQFINFNCSTFLYLGQNRSFVVLSMLPELNNYCSYLSLLYLRLFGVYTSLFYILSIYFNVVWNVRRLTRGCWSSFLSLICERCCWRERLLERFSFLVRRASRLRWLFCLHLVNTTLGVQSPFGELIWQHSSWFYIIYMYFFRWQWPFIRI